MLWAIQVTKHLVYFLNEIKIYKYVVNIQVSNKITNIKITYLSNK